jgi:hypothetical protein
MPDEEVDNDDIVERLGKIFKDMPPYTPCSVLMVKIRQPSHEFTFSVGISFIPYP